MFFGKKKRAIVRLLVVEDEPLIAFDTEHLLTDHDYHVVATVDRVAAALALFEEGAKIDLVLVDMQLADGSGIDVARTAHDRGVPVMFVTGNFSPDAEPFCIGCLDKPYQQRDLLNAIAVIDAKVGGRKIGKLPSGFRVFDHA